MSKVRSQKLFNLEAQNLGTSQMRAETFMEVAGRLVRQYETSGDIDFLLKAEKILGFIASDSDGLLKNLKKRPH